MSELTTHEVLVTARNLLNREGWCQRSLRQRRCPPAARVLPPLRRCAVGALQDAGERGAGTPAHMALEREIGGPITSWNDALGRTKEEVLAAFDRAIAATSPAPVDPLEGVEMAEVVA